MYLKKISLILALSGFITASTPAVCKADIFQVNGQAQNSIVELANLTQQIDQTQHNLKKVKVEASNINQVQEKIADYSAGYAKNNLALHLMLQSNNLQNIIYSANLLDLISHVDVPSNSLKNVLDGQSSPTAMQNEEKYILAQQENYLNQAQNLTNQLQQLENSGYLPSGQPYNVPKEIQYQDISPYYDQLTKYLKSKNSLQAEDPVYLQVINGAGKRWNVDPLLLLAITGQEQNFVPQNDPDAQLIISNPWNVFHSWQEFRGGYTVTALWAANTVAKCSQDCPQDTDVIQWINGFSSTGYRVNPNYGYADDGNWWIGVEKYYNELKGLCGEGVSTAATSTAGPGSTATITAPATTTTSSSSSPAAAANQ